MHWRSLAHHAHADNRSCPFLRGTLHAPDDVRVACQRLQAGTGGHVPDLYAVVEGTREDRAIGDLQRVKEPRQRPCFDDDEHWCGSEENVAVVTATETATTTAAEMMPPHK